MLLRLRYRLLLLELGHHVLQQLGMAEQIVLDDLLDLAALIGGEGLRARGSRGRQGQNDREQRGSEWARSKVHGRSSFSDQWRHALCGGL